jgi:hypothetical protein
VLRPRSLTAALTVPALAGLVVLAGASPATAYVRTLTSDTKVPLYWTQPRATLELAVPPEGFTVTPFDYQEAAQSAARTWSYPALECSAVELQVSPTMVEAQTFGFDGHNRVLIRTEDWCKDPLDSKTCRDSTQIALTRVTSRRAPGQYNDGEILDADIEINAENFTWSVIPVGEGPTRDFINDYDLASALTHEIGHFLGFAHTCLMAGEEPRYDQDGVPSPYCTEVSAGPVVDATMFPFIRPAEIRDRGLSSDDLVATCTTYASRPQEGMCQVARADRRGGHARDWSGPLGALALVGALLLRRRRAGESVARAATLRNDS